MIKSKYLLHFAVMMCFNVNVFISRLNMGVYGPTHFWSPPQEAIRGTTVFGITALASLFSPGTGCHLFSTHALLCLLCSQFHHIYSERSTRNEGELT